MTDGEAFVPSDWKVLKQVRNPWGQVALTDGGKSLHGRARAYMDKLLGLQDAEDPVSRRHHYVPKTYLRQWSFDGKRIWTLDTVTGVVRPLGLANVCVGENFYRVVGRDGAAHNRVELLFGVVDTELRRIQALFNRLEDPDELEFDDLMTLGVTMAVQRMRTLQQRRLQHQHNAWLVAQNPDEFPSIDDPDNPHSAAGIHTELLFKNMWDAADVLTTRQIEVWRDPRGRFTTCDVPVFVPFERNVAPSLLDAPYVIWPISPYRVVALGEDLLGEKAVIREATRKLVATVHQGVLQGRERMVFASQEHHDQLPQSTLPRRIQTRLRCSQRKPNGEYVQPPGCCVELSYTYAAGPDIRLCDQGLHRPASEMWAYR